MFCLKEPGQSFFPSLFLRYYLILKGHGDCFPFFVISESWACWAKKCSGILHLPCWIKPFSSCFDKWNWTWLIYIFFPPFFTSVFMWVSFCLHIQRQQESSGGRDCPLLFISGNDGEELAGSVDLLILSSGFVPHLLWGEEDRRWAQPQMRISSLELRSGQAHVSLWRSIGHWDLGVSFWAYHVMI